MYVFYEEVSGKIISLVDASGTPTAPSGYGYLPCTYDLSELYKYEVVSGVIQLKPQPEIDTIEETEAWFKLRVKRDQILAQCDWTQVPDAPVNQTEWATYRQALRDLPANTTDPANPTWPTQPS
jgi:hypothetical protein